MNDAVTVYAAELVRRLRSRSFWIGLIFGIVGVALMIKLPQFMDSYASSAKRIAIAADAPIATRARTLLERDFTVTRTLPLSSRAPSAAELERDDVSAIVALRRTAGGLAVTVYAKDPGGVPQSALRRDLLPLNVTLATALPAARVENAMNVPVTVKPIASKFGDAASADAARVIAYLLLFLLYVLIMVNSQLIMSSVAEEKTSRIAELLVASVSPSALLAGKIASSATVAVGQMVVWVACAVLLAMTGTHAASPGAMNFAGFTLAGISHGDVAGFVIFFLVGYLETATLFAALGSLVNRTEDLGSLSAPLLLPVIAGFIIAISALAVPDSPVVIVTSFIPLISPFVMFARIVVSTLPVWQIALSLAINLVAIWAIAVAGGKIYRVGMLMYGRPPRFSQIWQVLRS